MIGAFGKSLESIVSKKQTDEEYSRAGEGKTSWRPDYLDDIDEPEKSERNVDDERNDKIPKSRVSTDTGISPLGISIRGQKIYNTICRSKGS